MLVDGLVHLASRAAAGDPVGTLTTALPIVPTHYAAALPGGDTGDD